MSRQGIETRAFRLSRLVAYGIGWISINCDTAWDNEIGVEEQDSGYLVLPQLFALTSPLFFLNLMHGRLMIPTPQDGRIAAIGATLIAAIIILASKDAFGPQIPMAVIMATRFMAVLGIVDDIKSIAILRR